MSTAKVYRMDSVATSLLKSNPPSLLITAKGENRNNNYTNIRLEPRIYITPPADGIWEFDMVGEIPARVDTIQTKVSAEYEWKNFPDTVKAIKVYAATNSKTAKLGSGQPSSDGIELLDAKAWVDIQPIQPTPGGTLIVNIDYNSNDHGFHHLQPAVPQGINPKILLLEITRSNELIFINNPRHNSYSKGLETSDQYTSIDLVYQGQQVGSITDIPVVN